MLAFVLLAALQTDLPAELVTLGKIKAQMRQNLDRLPNYTCLETIERDQSREGKPFERLDLIKMEVANVGTRELYSWPGSRRFDEKGLTDLVIGGMAGTGDFALHARTVFRSNTPIFTYRGAEATALRYDYSVSRWLSGYRITTHISLTQKISAEVPYRGSFWVGAKSLELTRLAVYVDEIPIELGIHSADTRIDYGRVRIGHSEFLLPQSAEVELRYRNGTARRNRIAFSNCRQYAAESAVRFDDAPGDAASARTAVTEIELPAGFVIEAELEKPIDSDKSAVGDLVEARLRRPVPLEDGRVIPRGARVLGRIRVLGRHPDETRYSMLAIELSEIEFDNTRALFFGKLKTSDWSRGPRKPSVPQTVVWAVVEATLRDRGGPPLRVHPIEGVGWLTGEGRLVVPKGFKMAWLTIASPK